jgi:hypothetical protein
VTASQLRKAVSNIEVQLRPVPIKEKLQTSIEMLKEILHTKDSTNFDERLKRAASKSRDSVTTTILKQVNQLDEIIRFEAASR